MKFFSNQIVFYLRTFGRNNERTKNPVKEEQWFCDIESYTRPSMSSNNAISMIQAEKQEITGTEKASQSFYNSSDSELGTFPVG